MAQVSEPREAFDGVRLHVVTGKGGVGKTTVAAALGLALAAQGRKVLLAEVEGRQGISQAFDVAPLGTQEVRLAADASGGALNGLSVDAKAALLEYLQTFYKLGRAGAALEKFGAIDFATTIAPGVRDVLLIGKVYEATGRREGRRSGRGSGRSGEGPLVYDDVILDAPPTGRAVRFLNVNEEVADIARMGPIHGQAQSITRVLHATSTAVHLVTLLEEMPVQETLDAIGELGSTGFRLGAVIVNQVRNPILDEDQRDLLVSLIGDAASPPGRDETACAGNAAEAAAQRGGRQSGDAGGGSTALLAGIRADLEAVRVRATRPMVNGLLRQGIDHAARLSLQSDMLAAVTAPGLPVLTLPALPDGTEGGGISVLAETLIDQGVH